MEAATLCVQCTRFSYDLCVTRAQLQQQYEEVCILRKAQTDCTDMAAEIQALHTCVEEQRRHLQAESSKPKDPGVGIFSWMQTMSDQHQQRETELRDAHEQQIHALAVVHEDTTARLQQQLAYLTEQVTVMTTLRQQGHQLAVKNTQELAMAYRCISEQRRHIQLLTHEGVNADPDVGLLPLVRAGYVSLEAPVKEPVPPEVLTRAHMCFVLATDAAAVEVDTCRRQVLDAESANMKLRANLKNAETSMQSLRSENLSLNEKVTMLEKTANTVAFELLQSRNETLQVDVERLTKDRDATINGIRYWQGEAQKITADLVTAIESRDRFQAEQFTALKECRLLTLRVTDLERQAVDMHRFYQLGQQVFGLVQGVSHSPVATNSGGEAAATNTSEGANDIDGKKKKKNKKSNKKA